MEILFMNEKRIFDCVCPHCGAHIYKSDKYVRCEDFSKDGTVCSLFFGYVLADGSKIPDEDIVRLCTGDTIGPYTFHSQAKDKDYRCSLHVDANTGNVERIFPSHGEESEHVCPHCGKKLYKRNGKYGSYLSCPNRDFSMSLSFGGHELTDEEIETLMSGGTTEQLRLISARTKKPYVASLQIDSETGKIRPIFHDKQ